VFAAPSVLGVGSLLAHMRIVELTHFTRVIARWNNMKKRL